MLYYMYSGHNGINMRIGIRKLTFKDYSDIVIANFLGFYFFHRYFAYYRHTYS